jgi:hypothetical protein
VSSAMAQSLPSHLKRKPRTATIAPQCMDVECNATGDRQCLTASWEQAFHAALMTSVDTTVRLPTGINHHISNNSNRKDNYSNDTEMKESKGGADYTTKEPSVPIISKNPETSPDVLPPAALGRPCSDCGQRSIALYARGDDLICNGCRRRRPNKLLK